MKLVSEIIIMHGKNISIMISSGSLRKTYLSSIGCSEEHAALAATGLLSADLRGIDSHGIARLTGYVRLWEARRANPKPDIRIVHETPSTGVVDGDGGLGLVVAPFAMDLAINKAKNVGSGWIAVRNSNHFGIAAHHALESAERRYDRDRDDQCQCIGCSHFFH